MTYFHLLLWLVIFSWSSTAQLSRRDPGLTEYIIYPKEEAAKGDLDVFHQTLEKLTGISNIETIIDDGGDSPFSWRASLTSEQLNEVENHPVVFATQVNKPTVFNPDPELDTNLRHSSIKPSRAKRATVSRTPTADNDMLDLRMASTPPGQDLVENYVSEDSAGAGITVYILEFDAVMFHKELSPPYSSVTRRQIDADESLLTNERRKKSLTQHGTCVATKVAGKTTGPASQANLVLVRPGLETFSVFKAYESIRDDIKKNRLQGKAIITTSIQLFPEKGATKKQIKSLFSTHRRLVGQIIKLDVPIVCSAGNFAHQGQIEPNMLPAAMSQEFPIVVVGSTDSQGRMSYFSQRGKLVTTWALGEGVYCGDISKPKDLTRLRQADGTSFATPLVAGIIASWMSQDSIKFSKGKVAQEVRDRVVRFSYKRGDTADHAPMLWNGWQ